MTRRRRQLAGALSIFLAVTFAACGAGTPGGADPAPPPSAERADVLEAIFWNRIESDRERFTEADVRFMTAMIGHHAQALVVARFAPERASRASIRTLAARITNAQEDEISLMQQWLRDRGQPVPEVHISGTMLHIDGGADHTHAVMPGMLTQEQIETLAAARGADFDRLFLTYMIQHHRGAVAMVRELVDTDGAAQDPTLFKFASDVRTDQATEIARMERMLAEISAGSPLP